MPPHGSAQGPRTGEAGGRGEADWVLRALQQLTFASRAQPKIFKLEPVMVSRAQKQLRHTIPIG
eukprot:884216-Rhodomonas_salina.3